MTPPPSTTDLEAANLAAELAAEAAVVQDHSSDYYETIERHYGGPGALAPMPELVEWCRQNPQQADDFLQDLRRHCPWNDCDDQDAETDLARPSAILERHGARGFYAALYEGALGATIPQVDEAEAASPT